MSQVSLSVPESSAALPAAPETGATETVIRPKKGWIGVDWRELVSHRELLYFLTWRDVKVKYKQAMFGSAWAIVVPLASVMIYTIVGHFAGFSSRTEGTTPYAVYIYAGLLPWLFLQTAINGGGMALVNNQSLLSKIYMPRIFIPSSMIGSAIVDFAMSSIVFAAMLAFYTFKTAGTDHAFVPSWQSVFVLPLFVLLVIAALGTAYLLSALTIMFRDLRFIIPFITQLGVWLTAVVYPQRIFGEYRQWLALNPFAGIVQGFRSAILGEPWQMMQLYSSIVLSILLFVLGLFYFKRVERRFADIA
ncbi:MAG: ABC transporter permease [Burkholderiales bacterium]|nr:ABC transporter permease [Phycisphaerae bacterium]